jgi:hypothetical protein
MIAARDQEQAREIVKGIRMLDDTLSLISDWRLALADSIAVALAQRETEVREACALLADAATERETDDPGQLAIKNVAAMIAAAIRGRSEQVVLCFWEVELANVRCALHNGPVLACPVGGWSIVR